MSDGPHSIGDPDRRAHAPYFLHVPPCSGTEGAVNVIVEIPKGRRNKYELDKRTGLFRLDRYLYSSLHYPGDYGFIPQTLTEDGDPIDVLVMVNEPTFTGCLIEVRPIGLFTMQDEGRKDYKILGVPHFDPTFDTVHDLEDVPPHFLREVEHFFATYKELQAEQVVTRGWESLEAARTQIRDAIHRGRGIGTPPADPPDRSGS